ncbi:predicted protein [Naegleria gruberi]|uniref:Predicted protein n=1 Tax=Naegleria gruberi TaxID=5762 RepID=D2VLE4_NAEGR|nr:uncharacterized protein NAEGRDRAFT_50513 [Naegleria gruberi]EFC42296.1 predicted protein [Naegleria gruberi]|eukprot:XP_002675040.1 predicted protein [Naegleria gruberi strain NEG-M]
MQELMFQLILDGAPIALLSDRLRHNKEFIIELLRYCNIPLNELEEQFQYDVDVVLQSVSNDPNNYTFLSNSIKSERSVTIQMINNAYKIKDFTNSNKTFVRIFEKYIPMVFRNDREIMELSLRQDSSIMPLVSDALKNNKEFVVNALKISTTCFPHISLELRSDPEVCLLALRNSNSKTMIMTHMNCLLLYDEDFMREIVSIDGMLLSYAPSAEIIQNRDVVLIAVKQNGFALQHADKSLRNDEEIVREAIMQDGETIMFASERLRDNFELMAVAVTKSKVALLYASERLKSDENLVSISVYSHPSSLKFASAQLLQNSQFIEHLIRNGVTNY